MPVMGGGDVPLTVAYPNRYWIAMSNLGFQTVYRLFAQHPRFAVERAYLAEEEDEPWRTFERAQPLSAAEILAVSVSFETDYPHVVSLVEAAGRDLNECWETRAAPEQAVRRFGRPLILGGGAALTLNPEPLANLFDAIVIGEGEEVIAEIAECYLRARDEDRSFAELLHELANIEGVYVPSLYGVRYREDGRIDGFTNDPAAPARVMRRYLQDLDAYPTYTTIQTPETEFKAMFMTETGRGCEIGCRFCVAGYMYRPIRKRGEDVLRETVKIGLENGSSVGFVGAAVSSHPAISRLASSVAERGGRAALSSIMSQRVTPELAGSLSESEYKTVALAPEAGSEELRFRVGKRVCDEQIIDAVATLAAQGIRNFKLYFIVGFPGERPSDVEAIVSLVARARDRALEAARTQADFKTAPVLLLSVNPFIPKAWTPFQRMPHLRSAEVKRRLAIVQQGVKKLANVEMKFESPRESYFQAFLSRGDRRVGDVLIRLHQLGRDWRWLVKHGGEQIVPGVPPADFYVHRTLDVDEVLPWEVVDLRIKRSLLERECERTFEEDVAPLIERARKMYAEERA